MNLTCSKNSTGYGVVGINVHKELSKLVDLAHFPLGGNYPTQYDKTAPSVRIFHEFDCAHHPSRGKWGVLPIYELDRLRADAIYQLNQNDVIFQCSQWAVDVANDNGIKVKQVIAPLGVDADTFFPLPPHQDGVLRFLNIGKWEVRKGQDVLVEAFNNAFEEEKDVELWLACHNNFINNEDWARSVLNTKMGKANKIKLVPPMNTQQDVNYLMNYCDVGVFPFRAEGWNLELLEMMACGKPVIATNYSGATQFINKDNCVLLEPDGLEVAYDGLWFHGQGRWAALEKNYKDSLVEALRSADKTKNSEGLKTAKQFNWANTARIIYEEMRS